ncbi:dihydrolipoyl dehydrogenase family protein [Companilactobacillus kimchii]|uniref:Glutathione reductase n=2 Tax=Companilactobacillus kimchii TaxID=2801452 RepID=A0ABR5NQ78_9LACO|nr:NAD(P)/FAD-dependent oxidoreductase [Companilactobacillus kimchii]KAE9562777.1 glutathione reductase [Companilactobacillus kimchii]KRK49807.1 glutathione reductase [Companilactobacillus kimchii DSM 13961 = JCM 10707]OWF33226.1 Dihydrolipoyl dehydrogenase [Companilactobacillus kimchii]GEO46689.1 glutathione reductase [Companilactobacillus paralimentarius]
MEKFDTIIIGAGPGGLAAAYDLSEAGQNVALIENNLWGGTCPNRGCDPKKVLLSAVEARDRMTQLKGKGFGDVPYVNWEELEKFKATFTDPVSAGSKKGAINAGITAIDGSPKFVSEKELSVNESTYQADHFIIATGQRPSYLDIPGKEYLLSSTDFLSLKQMPKTITIIGAGYIAFELATIANATGAEVHVVHHNDHPLKAFNEKYAQELVHQLEAKGVKFHFNVDTKEIVKSAGQLTLKANDFSLTSDLIIGATGRIPNIDILDLEKANVKTDRHGVVVNEKLQSSNDKIFAIGDVVSTKIPKLTPVAGFEADYVSDVILGKTTDDIKIPLVPTVVYGTPKLAQVGEQNGAEVVDQDVTSWFTYSHTNEPKAMIRIVLNDKSQIIGATVLSNEADSMINLLTKAIEQKMTHSDVKKEILAYPTAGSDLEYLF